MRIAIDCRMFNCSGIGNVLKDILTYLPSNNDYLLVGNKNDLLRYKARNVDILDCVIPIFSIKELFCFPSKIINKYDAFFSPNYNIPLFISIKKYSMIHDVVFLDLPYLTGKLGFIARYFYILRAIKISSKVFTVSEFSKERIVYFVGHKDKIEVIRLGIPQPLKNCFPRIQKKNNNEPYFVFVGNVKKHKGIDVLIKGFQAFADKNYKLYIVGKRDSFRTYFTELDISMDDNICFTDFLGDSDLYNLIYNSKALIQPSLYEGFGLPPLEALYLGVPVILSDIPVFKEIYERFPVIFFKSGDYSDLAAKMKAITPQVINRVEILTYFDFSKSEKKIFSIIENNSKIISKNMF